MKVLVIARDAQIRDALVTQFNKRNRPYHCEDSAWLAARESTVVIPSDIGIVINASSLEELTGPKEDVSLGNVERLAEACERANVALIHLSSGQIFDGIDGGRYRESDDVKSASRVGSLLVQIEQIVTQRCSHHIVLRTGTLFSAKGDNVLTSLLAQFQNKEPLLLSNTGKGCPIHAADLARVVSGMVDQLGCGSEAWGIYHYHSSDPASRFKFAEAVLAAVSQFNEALGYGVRLEPYDEVDSDWCQPLLNCEKVLNTFGIKQLPWRLLVVQTVRQLVGPTE